MRSPAPYAGAPIETYGDDFWTTRPTGWPDSTSQHGLDTDNKAPRASITHIKDHSDECDPADHSVPAIGRDAVGIPPAHQVTRNTPGFSATSTRSKADQRQDLQEYTRSDIELQLATINRYIHNKKLKPIEWTCCSCGKEQRYRENLDPLDRLRCQYPRCGVSDKGFRIYRVHNMCDSCTVFVDQRAPVTKNALKKKRDEVRDVLRKIKKIYEDVDCLAEFDDKEAAEMATLVRERGARDELERERQEEQDLHKAEMERQQREEWVDDSGNHCDTVSQYEESEEATEPEDWEKNMRRKHQSRRDNKVQKKRGFKALLGL